MSKRNNRQVREQYERETLTRMAEVFQAEWYRSHGQGD